MVPLAELLKRELKNEKIEKPTIRHGQAGQSKKGEDFTLMKLECQKIPGDGSSTFAVFAVCSAYHLVAIYLEIFCLFCFVQLMV